MTVFYYNILQTQMIKKYGLGGGIKLNQGSLKYQKYYIYSESV